MLSEHGEVGKLGNWEIGTLGNCEIVKLGHARAWHVWCNLLRNNEISAYFPSTGKLGIWEIGKLGNWEIGA